MCVQVHRQLDRVMHDLEGGGDAPRKFGTHVVNNVMVGRGGTHVGDNVMVGRVDPLHHER